MTKHSEKDSKRLEKLNSFINNLLVSIGIILVSNKI